MTIQLPDTVQIEGKIYALDNYPHIKEGDDIIRRTGYAEIFESTACHRRYLAAWDIENGKLYLSDIQGKYGLKNKERLFADWVTGVVIVVQGKTEDMIIYEHYIVEQGKVIGHIFDEEVIEVLKPRERTLIEKLKSLCVKNWW